MRRRVFTLASLISLLLLVATVVLWVRSWRKFDVLTCHRDRVYQAVSEEGLLRLQRLSVVARKRTVTSRKLPGSGNFVSVPLSGIEETALRYDDSAFARLNREFGTDKPWHIRNWRTTLPRSVLPRLFPVSMRTTTEADFTIIQHQREEYVIGYALQVPYWVFVAMAGVLPFFYTLGVIRRRAQWLRMRRGLCQSCSYDLSGNTSGVCPECGVAVTSTLV